MRQRKVSNLWKHHLEKYILAFLQIQKHVWPNFQYHYLLCNPCLFKFLGVAYILF